MKNYTKESMIVVGNINLDITFKLHRMPQLDENIRSTMTWVGLGGSAVNYCFSAKRLGHNVGLVARAGYDVERLGLIDLLNKEGIDISRVLIEKDIDTGKVVVLLLMDSDSRILITYRGANDRLSANDIECSDSIRFYHFASVNPEIVLSFIERCPGKIYSYDPGGWIYNNPYGVLDLFKYVNILHLNRIELIHLSKRTGLDLEKLDGTTIHAPHIITVKRGKEGAYLYWGNKKFSSRLDLNIDVVDTTGAGDAFDAAFNVRYIETGNPIEALKYGVATGGLKVTRLGSSNMPYRDEIESVLDKVKLSRID